MYNNSTIGGDQNLLSCFFTVCEQEFRFLETEHGFSYFSGLLEYAKGRHVLRPCNPRAVQGSVFDAATIYDNGPQALEITFNGTTSMLDFFVCYNRVNRFSLAEIISAARRPFPPKTERIFSPDPLTLKADIMGVARVAQKNRNLLTDPNPKIIERTLTIREKLMEQQIRAQFKKDLEDTKKQAARAFMSRNFVRTVMLLTPFESYLDDSSYKKMAQARQKLLGK